MASTAKRAGSKLAHRVQVARARRFLRGHVGDDVQLVAVARAAGASMFHLARLYRAITGETVGRALTRMRIERAAEALLELPARSVSAIALESGFRTPSSLTKAFRAALGVAPTEFRAATAVERRRALARLVVEPPEAAAYELSAPVVVRADDMRVVYVRETGPYSAISAPLAWAALEVRLAGTRLLAGQHVGASYDDPRKVPVDALRYDAGVIVGPSVQAPPGTKIATWRGGAFASFAVRGEYSRLAAAFDEIFGAWLTYGFRLRPSPCLEMYRHMADERADATPTTEIWIPIEEPKR